MKNTLNRKKVKKSNCSGRNIALSILLTAAAVLLLAACGSVTEIRTPTALVMLCCDDGITVNGENPVRVKLGESAVFDVTVAEGKTVDTLENCEYADGKITVSDVKLPVTATATSRDLAEYRFFINTGIKSSVVEGTKLEGTEITLTADSTSSKTGEERVFIGFSNWKPLAKGGELLSYSPTYTFTLTQNMNIYANYASEGAQIIVYHANGGTASGGGDVLYIETNDEHHTCPNALINTTYFTRDGYMLAGYNTEADGSGRFYGCGWNVVMPDSGIQQLYCVWMKVTPEEDFTFTSLGTSVTVKSYNGDDDVVVIPETVNGKKVASIASKAFDGKKMTALYLTRNLITVGKNAIYNCPNLTTLYLADTVGTIMDESISNCDSFKTLIVEASTEPRYQSTRNGNYQNKYERLLTAESPKLVIVSGSNSAYGVDSPTLEKLLGNKYNVVNYGNHQNAPVCLFIEIAAAWASEGDILVHNPECFSQWQHGRMDFSTTVWQYVEGCYGCLSVVDISRYNLVFSSFSSYSASRKSRAAQTYETYAYETVNAWGDFSLYKEGQVFTPGYNSHNYDGKSTFAFAENLNNAYQIARDAGMKVYMSFGVVDVVTLTEKSRLKTVQDAFVKLREETFTPDAFISDMSVYIMDNKYFYNADYHLTTEGAAIRTKNLANDILAQLEKEKAQ